MALYPAIGVYGFPKSGNTWLEGVFRNIGQQVQPRYTQVDIHISRRNKNKFNVHPSIKIGDSPCIIFKSHEKFSSQDNFMSDRDALGISELKKVILVKRNPFDMLLSYLNYAVWSIRRALAADSSPPQDMKNYLLSDINVTNDQYEKLLCVKDVLAYMKQYGIADNALQLFIKQNFGIPPFTHLYGTWLEQIVSWEQQKDIEVLSVRYEDLIRDLPSQIRRINSFLNISEEDLTNAFTHHQGAARKVRTQETENLNVSFFNKCTSCYFNDIFSRELIDSILNGKAESFTLAGYSDLREICSRQ